LEEGGGLRRSKVGQNIVWPLTNYELTWLGRFQENAGSEGISSISWLTFTESIMIDDLTVCIGTTYSKTRISTRLLDASQADRAISVVQTSRITVGW
jgi:hypothetical protein